MKKFVLLIVGAVASTFIWSNRNRITRLIRESLSPKPIPEIYENRYAVIDEPTSFLKTKWQARDERVIKIMTPTIVSAEVTKALSSIRNRRPSSFMRERYRRKHFQ